VYAAHRNKISNQTLHSTALAKPTPWVIDDMMPKNLRTRMQLISKDFQANDDDSRTRSCLLDSCTRTEISLTAASKPGQVGTAALLGEQQSVLHHLLRVASRLELSAQTVLVHGLHHLTAARRWSARPSAFHRGQTRHE
jgi:hypothetical protein